MKRKITVLLAILIVFVTGLFSLSAFAGVDELEIVQPDEYLVTINRFENMLNLNNAFGDDFESVSSLLYASEISLIEKARDGKIENVQLIDFAKEMYGVDAAVYSDEGKELLSKDGTTEILARGYCVYTHKIERTEENEDGTFTVYSLVNSTSHDTESVTLEAISRFVPAKESRFGYYLISCELFESEKTVELSAVAQM